NGAGKSTLMLVLGGVHTDYRGAMFLDGQILKFSNPKEAITQGIGIIYQELDLVPEFSVGENILLGYEPAAKTLGGVGLLSRRRIFSETQKLLDDLGFNLRPQTPVKSLSVGERQLVQIVKAIRLSAKVLVMDEPTARLAYHETETLFKIIASLKQRGISIIYISHHMEEILRVADRVTVLRDGKVVGTVAKESTSLPEIIRMVVGKELAEGITRADIAKGQELIAVDGLTKEGRFENISFRLKAGEILGIGGLVGSGRSEIAQCIFGAAKPTSGAMHVNGRPVKLNSPLDAIKHAIILVPEERKAQGLILNHSVLSNLSLALLRFICKWRCIRQGERQATAQAMVRGLGIKTASLRQAVGHLSGGNQQKVVIGKWLPLKPKICLLDQPTRGIDIGAKQEIYNLIVDLARKGTGVIMISDELSELIGLCDRIIVIGKGRQISEFTRGEVNQNQLLAAIVRRETRVAQGN
ncbi:MAG: sugar ABC transporter ATP-binding protein, partial [Desulfobacterales bacterium]